MNTWIYTVLTKRFYVSKGVEYAVTTSSADIECFCRYHQAVSKLDNQVNKLCAQGFHVADSDAPDDDDNYSLMVRLESKTGKVVVIELAWKILDGTALTIQDRTSEGPTRPESKPTGT